MSDWQAAATFYNGRRAADPTFDVIGDLFASRRAWNELTKWPNNWPELVKIVRSVFLVPIDEAHRLILAHGGFRRLAQAAIDADADCHAYVRKLIRKGGLAGLAKMRGDRPVIDL